METLLNLYSLEYIPLVLLEYELLITYIPSYLFFHNPHRKFYRKLIS